MGLYKMENKFWGQKLRQFSENKNMKKLAKVVDNLLLFIQLFI